MIPFTCNLEGPWPDASRSPRSRKPSACHACPDGHPVSDIGTAFSNAAKRAELEYPVCPYDIRHLWITTMLDKKVEISAIAHLAGTSPRMIIKNYYGAHASEKEKAVALLPKLGEAREAPIRLVKPVQVA